MAVFSRIKTWVSNEVLTAADLNAEFNNIINNMQPDGIEDASATVADMQASTNPGGVGTESQATDLLGEIKRLRYVVQRLVGTYWYSDPGRYLTAGGLNVQTADIAAGVVTEPKLASNAVSTAKIVDGAVTKAKLSSSIGEQLSLSCSNYTTTSSSYLDVTNLSVSLTTTGRPVRLELLADGSTNISYIGVFASTGSNCTASFAFAKDGTRVAEYAVSFDGLDGSDASYVPSSAMSYTLTGLAAGTYTFKVQTKVTANAGTPVSYVYYCKLLAYEL